MPSPAEPSATKNKAALERQARSAAQSLGLAGGRVEQALARQDYFDLIAALLPLRPSAPPGPLAELREAAEGLLRRKAFGFPPPGRGGKLEPVVFGTGGHRGEIGVGLTLVHIHAIVAALLARIDAIDPGQRAGLFGAETVEEVKRRGFLIGHDNRLFNPDFSFYAAHLFSSAGYKVGYAGRVATPQISMVVPLQGWAGALNFTPSHNPFRYGGIKVNPTDGGLAGADLSDPIALEANRWLEELKEADWPSLEALERLVAGQAEQVARVDLHGPYLERLKAHPVVRLGELAETVRSKTGDEAVRFVVDPVFGAAVPIYRRLQGLFGEEAMILLHAQDDPYFDGQTTEPNEETLNEARAALKNTSARYKVAIRNDPDGDRGLVGDLGRAIPMNQFAALVMKYLIDLEQPGDVATTVATSRFGAAYARARGREVFLTPVGVKNFRPFLLDNRVMVAYEESDGLTIAGHTLDKDGVLAGLLALRIVLHYGRSLSELVAEIEAETGVHHYRQINFSVEVTAAEVREKLQRLASLTAGQTLGQGPTLRTVSRVDTTDGYLFDFREGGWILLRPSGTEPKVRIYAESLESREAMDALCELGKNLAMEVILGRR